MSRHTETLKDGAPFPLPERVLCCSCGHAHDLKAEVRDDGVVWVSFRTNARATAATRRQYPYTHRKVT